MLALPLHILKAVEEEWGVAWSWAFVYVSTQRLRCLSNWGSNSRREGGRTVKTTPGKVQKAKDWFGKESKSYHRFLATSTEEQPSSRQTLLELNQSKKLSIVALKSVHNKILKPHHLRSE